MTENDVFAIIRFMKLKAAELRLSEKDEIKLNTIKRNPVYIVLDNVLDTYNIGAVFRLADAVAAEKVLLCEGSETPPNHRIKKASINTTEWVQWEYFNKTIEAVEWLRKNVENIHIVAVEQAEGSVPFQQADYSFPIALIVGHETVGVSTEVLSLVDTIVELPMWGVNVSLNVMVSLGIVLYEVMKNFDQILE